MKKTKKNPYMILITKVIMLEIVFGVILLIYLYFHVKNAIRKHARVKRNVKVLEPTQLV